MNQIDTVKPTTRPDPENPASYKKFSDYVREPSKNPPPAYMFERNVQSPKKFTVRANRYFSPRFAALENERLWAKVWQIACRTNDIPKIGDYVEYEIAHYSILVVRNKQGGVSAFHNACRHRGMAVARGCGNVNEFNCPFHAWRYELDGSLKSVPAAWDFKHVRQAESGLIKCQVDVFDGYVFINLDPKAKPLREFLGETVSRHLMVHPDERMWKSAHFGVVVNCNWKVICEAFMETYHIARTHPTLIPSVADLQTEYDYYGPHARLCNPTGMAAVMGGGEYTQEEIFESMISRQNAKFASNASKDSGGRTDINARRDVAARIRDNLKKSRGVDVSHLTDTEILDAMLYQIFPNYGMFKNSCGKLNYRFRPYGDDPGKSVYELMLLLPVPKGAPLPKDTPLQMLKPGERLEDHADKLGVLGYLIDQDIDNCAEVQHGLRNLEYVNLGQTMEANILHFHEDLDRYIGPEAEFEAGR